MNHVADVRGTRRSGRSCRPGRRLAGRVPLAIALALAACGQPAPQPDVDTLRASFIAQIESIDLVADLEARGR